MLLALVLYDTTSLHVCTTLVYAKPLYLAHYNLYYSMYDQNRLKSRPKIQFMNLHQEVYISPHAVGLRYTTHQYRGTRIL